jgi:hypothetical protein
MKSGPDRCSQGQLLKIQTVLPQNPGQIAIVAAIFVVLGLLLAHFEPGSIAGFGGLALTFLIYLIPTSVTLTDSNAT